MKKILSFVVLAALVFGMASCEKKDQPTELAAQSPKFNIEIVAVTDTSATFNITPADKEITYDFVVFPAAEKDDFDVASAEINSNYKMLDGIELYVGDLQGVQVTDLMGETDYTLAVFKVDVMDSGQKEATFASFTTEPWKVVKTVPFEDQNAEIIDYTATGYYYYDGKMHYGWQLEAYCGDYNLWFETDDTEDIAGTYDPTKFVSAGVKYEGIWHEIESGRVTVTGTKPDYEITGFMIDSKKVRFDLNIRVTKYEIGSEE